MVLKRAHIINVRFPADRRRRTRQLQPDGPRYRWSGVLQHHRAGVRAQELLCVHPDWQGYLQAGSQGAVPGDRAQLAPQADRHRGPGRVHHGKSGIKQELKLLNLNLKTVLCTSKFVGGKSNGHVSVFQKRTNVFGRSFIFVFGLRGIPVVTFYRKLTIHYVVFDFNTDRLKITLVRQSKRIIHCVYSNFQEITNSQKTFENGSNLNEQKSSSTYYYFSILATHFFNVLITFW